MNKIKYVFFFYNENIKMNITDDLKLKIYLETELF